MSINLSFIAAMYRKIWFTMYIKLFFLEEEFIWRIIVVCNTRSVWMWHFSFPLQNANDSSHVPSWNKNKKGTIQVEKILANPVRQHSFGEISGWATPFSPLLFVHVMFDLIWMVNSRLKTQHTEHNKYMYSQFLSRDFMHKTGWSHAASLKLVEI